MKPVIVTDCGIVPSANICCADALEKLLNVPRIFLPTVLKGCVAWAKEHGVTEVTAAEMKIINDKRAKEKGKG